MSVPVNQNWLPNISKESYKASLLHLSKCADTSSSNINGAEPYSNFNNCECAKMIAISNAFCYPVEAILAGTFFPTCQTEKSLRCGPGVFSEIAENSVLSLAKQRRHLFSTSRAGSCINQVSICPSTESIAPGNGPVPTAANGAIRRNKS